MSYRPTKETQHWQAPPGLAPWRELTDDEHAALEAEHGDLSRWYERVDEHGLRTGGVMPAPDRKKRAATAAGGES